MSTPISLSESGTFSDTLLNGKFVALTDSGHGYDQLYTLDGLYDTQVAADDPIAWWKFDELSGTTFADATTNAHTLDIIAGPPTFGDPPAGGKMGGTSVTFAAGPYAVDSASTAWLDTLNTGSFTIEFWFKANADGVILHRGFSRTNINETYEIYLGSGTLVFQYCYNSFNQTSVSTTGINFEDNRWHHGVVTYNAFLQVKIYVDGILNATGTVPGLPLQTTTPLAPFTIAAAYNGSGYVAKFSGSLDQIAMYPRVLPAARILAHYVSALSIPYRVSSATAKLTSGTISPTFGRVPIAGNLLLARVGLDGSASTPSCPTPAGWTLAASHTSMTSSVLGDFVYFAVAAGGDSPPVFSPFAVDGACLLEEWINTDSYTAGNSAFVDEEFSFSFAETPSFRVGANDLVVHIIAQSNGTGIANCDMYADPGFIGGDVAMTPYDVRYGTGVSLGLNAAHYVPDVSDPYGGVLGSNDFGPKTLLAVAFGTNKFVTLDDTGAAVDDMIATTKSIVLDEAGTFDDVLIVSIPGGPTIPAVLEDVMGASDVEVTGYVDGIPFVTLAFVEGRSDVSVVVIGDHLAALEPVDGSSEVLMNYRTNTFASLTPVDGSSLVIFVVGDPTTGGVGALAQVPNQPIAIAVSLTGTIYFLRPVGVA